MKKELPDCCKPKKEYKGKNPLKGLMYGLIPHIGCIMFIFASILGVTVLIQFFRPLLMNRNIFYYLILVSIGFATISSFFYLRKNKSLSWKGIKNKKGYLTIMYGSTVGINILLFFFIFPLLANVSLTGAAIYQGNPNDLSSLTLQVNIPCPGHAPLISNELKTINGVYDVEFSFPNYFDVEYSTETSEQEILSLEVFGEYPTQVLGDDGKEIKEVKEVTPKTPTTSSTCSGGCGGTGSCGGSCGSPTCNYNR